MKKDRLFGYLFDFFFLGQLPTVKVLLLFVRPYKLDQIKHLFTTDTKSVPLCFSGIEGLESGHYKEKIKQA